MLINSDHPVVQALVADWKSAQSASGDDRLHLSIALQERLAEEILKLIAPFRDELVLLYHEFLTMVPSGAHSFAYGSEMVSDMVYWTHVARLPALPTLFKERSPESERELGDQLKIRFAPSTTFLVPVAWQWNLYPYYPSGGNRPSFGFTIWGRLLPLRARREPDKVSEPRAEPLNISCLGEHLFRLREDRHDWATRICLIAGTLAVKQWLEEHGSAETYQSLRAFKGLV